MAERVRRTCLGFPETEERLSHGTPAFFVRRSCFVYSWVRGHHDHTFPHLWCAAPSGAQEALAERDGWRYFRPPYVGHRGWIGVRLDGAVDWGEIEERCEDAWRAVAPGRVVERFNRTR
jgi:hypothetical protein